MQINKIYISKESLCLCVLVIFKILVFGLLHFLDISIFSGGNDADYYDAYAKGDTDDVANIWPVLLRALNVFGLYSRESITVIIAFFGIIYIPYLVAKICVVINSPLRKKIFSYAFIIVSLYPAIFYYIFDIYRDIFMISCFLIGLFCLKKFIYSRINLNKIFYFSCSVLIGYFLYLLRPYLGLSFFAMIVFGFFYNFGRYSALFCIFFYLLFLQITYNLDFLSPLLSYRTLFESVEAGANIGIQNFSSYNFLINFFYSLLTQLFGIFFFNFLSLILFIVESVPFFFLLLYILKNRKYSNAFVDNLVVFTVFYTSIWILGNDNLGTAMRLRIFSYIPVLIAFFVIYQNKIIINVRLSENRLSK